MTPPALLLRPTGRLDADSCSELRQQLATAFSTGVQSLAVDLSAVTEVDLTGLQVISGAAKHLRRRDGLLVITKATPAVVKMLRVNGLAELLEVPQSAPLRVVASEKDPEPSVPGRPVRRLRVVSPDSA